MIPAVRRKVLEVMRTSPQTEERLRQRLEEQGLRVIIRKTDNGRIYGITFIDDEKGIALNGSRLGKGYAANKFNEYFSNPEKIHSWMNRFMVRLIPPFNNRCRQYSRMSRKATILSMNLLTIWWENLFLHRVMMIGKKRHGSVNFADKAR